MQRSAVSRDRVTVHYRTKWRAAMSLKKYVITWFFPNEMQRVSVVHARDRRAAIALLQHNHVDPSSEGRRELRVVETREG